MKELRQVVWAEGMFLSQQHFQMWDDYAQGCREFQRELVAPLAWGIVELDIHKEALLNGQFQVSDYRVAFHDGTIAVKGDQEPPLTYGLTATAEGRISVYMGVPENRSVTGISGYRDNTKLPAKVAQYANIADCYDQARVREVLLSTPRLYLLGEDNARDGFISFKIAEVEAIGDGKFRLVQSYIPPCVYLESAPALLAGLDRILEIVRAKVRSLAERRRQRSQSVAEFSNADVAHFWLLNALNTALPGLNHLRAMPRQHPERLYNALAQLAGTLCTFSFAHSVEDIPRYQHHDLTGVFGTIEGLLRDLVDTVVSSNVMSVMLQKDTNSIYVASGFDWQLLDEGVFYLGVKSDQEGQEWIGQFERMIKIGARDTIDLIVGAALPGVIIEHQQRPPSQLPIRTRYEYFRINSRGEFWESIVKSTSIGVYVPQAFAGVSIELLCVRE